MPKQFDTFTQGEWWSTHESGKCNVLRNSDRFLLTKKQDKTVGFLYVNYFLNVFEYIILLSRSF